MDILHQTINYIFTDQFLGRFTFLVTVYYANILRRNWINFVFTEEKRLLNRLINVTVPVSDPR